MLFERFRKKKDELFTLPKQMELFREDVIDLTKSINNVFQEMKSNIFSIEVKVNENEKSIKNLLDSKPLDISPKEIKSIQLSMDLLKKNIDISLKDINSKISDIESKLDATQTSIQKINKDIENLGYMKSLSIMLSEINLSKTNGDIKGVFFTQNSKEAKKDSISVCLPNGTTVYLKNI